MQLYNYLFCVTLSSTNVSFQMLTVRPLCATMGERVFVSLLGFGVIVHLATRDNIVNKVSCSRDHTRTAARHEMSSV